MHAQLGTLSVCSGKAPSHGTIFVFSTLHSSHGDYGLLHACSSNVKSPTPAGLICYHTHIWHFSASTHYFPAADRCTSLSNFIVFWMPHIITRSKVMSNTRKQPTGLLLALHPPCLSIVIPVRIWELWKPDASGSPSTAGRDGTMRLLRWCCVWPAVQRKGPENAKQLELKNETMHNICMRPRVEGFVSICFLKKGKRQKQWVKACFHTKDECQQSQYDFGL